MPAGFDLADRFIDVVGRHVSAFCEAAERKATEGRLLVGMIPAFFCNKGEKQAGPTRGSDQSDGVRLGAAGRSPYAQVKA